MSSNELMIEVKDLTKSYGAIRALDGVSFEVRRGEVLGFLGPNGAGKTTTMKILTCFIAPTAGQVFVGGMDIYKDPLEIRRNVGYLPENAPLYPDMLVSEYLDFAGVIRGMSGADRKAAADRVIGQCGLDGVVYQEIRTLSKGFRQRAGLAQAMLHNPRILILDEPTSGLDPNQIAEIRALIKDIGKEHTVILSTHHLAEVQATAGRVVIINKGKRVADGTPRELERQRGGALYEVVLSKPADGADEIPAVFERIDGVDAVEKMESADDELVFAVTGHAETDVRSDIFNMVVEKGWVLLGLVRKQVDLEDIFRSLTVLDAPAREISRKSEADAGKGVE